MNNPYQQGYKAWLDGTLKSECPYDCHTEEWNLWQDGWWDAGNDSDLL